MRALVWTPSVWMPACARGGDGLGAHRVQRHRGEGDRGLLARGEEHVHLALGGKSFAGDLVGELDEVVRHPGHRGNDGDHLMTLGLRLKDAARDIADPFGRADGGAAIFLDDEAHGFGRVESAKTRARLMPQVPDLSNVVSWQRRMGSPLNSLNLTEGFVMIPCLSVISVAA